MAAAQEVASNPGPSARRRVSSHQGRALVEQHPTADRQDLGGKPPAPPITRHGRFDCSGLVNEVIVGHLGVGAKFRLDEANVRAASVLWCQ